MPSVDEFRSALRSLFREAELQGSPYVEINSGQLHRNLDGYPGPKAQMLMLSDHVSRAEGGR